MISKKPSLTDAGQALLLRALNGETLTFTRLAIGSGQLASGQDQGELTELITEELSISLTGIDTTQEGLIALSADFTNDDVPRDFKWRELGVFAKGGEDNIELLYAYVNDGDDAGTLRALTTDILTEQTLTVIVEIADAENIGAIFNPHPTYAPLVTLQAHMNNYSNPHHVTKSQIGLGNVLNLAPSNMPIYFQDRHTSFNFNNEEPISGEALYSLFSKILNIYWTVRNHTYSRSNPHQVTKSQIGLGNVVNKAPNNMTLTFTEADEVANLDADKDLISGSSLSALLGKIASAVHTLFSHLANKSNPHEVTKAQVGLGNVENTAPSFNVIEFESRNTYAVPETGETMTVIMSKIAKDLTDLGDHIDTQESPNPHGITLGKIAAIGNYTGDGIQGRTVSLDFDPSAVMVYDEFGRTYDDTKGVCGGIATSDKGVREPGSAAADATTWNNSGTALMCVTGGFKVNYVSGSINTNENDAVYFYIAYK